MNDKNKILIILHDIEKSRRHIKLTQHDMCTWYVVFCRVFFFRWVFKNKNFNRKLFLFYTKFHEVPAYEKANVLQVESKPRMLFVPFVVFSLQLHTTLILLAHYIQFQCIRFTNTYICMFCIVCVCTQLIIIKWSLNSCLPMEKMS